LEPDPVDAGVGKRLMSLFASPCLHHSGHKIDCENRTLINDEIRMTNDETNQTVSFMPAVISIIRRSFVIVS